MVEVKQTIESTEENRKTEKVIKIESKLTAAEQKREQELQRKLEKIKENVRIPLFIYIFFCFYNLTHLHVAGFCVQAIIFMSNSNWSNKCLYI